MDSDGDGDDGDEDLNRFQFQLGLYESSRVSETDENVEDGGGGGHVSEAWEAFREAISKSETFLEKTQLNVQSAVSLYRVDADVDDPERTNPDVQSTNEDDTPGEAQTGESHDDVQCEVEKHVESPYDRQLARLKREMDREREERERRIRREAEAAKIERERLARIDEERKRWENNERERLRQLRAREEERRHLLLQENVRLIRRRVAARMLNRHARRYLTVKRQRTQSTLTVQRVMRGFLCRTRVQRLRDTIRSALIAQRIVRGYFARSHVRQVREKIRQEATRARIAREEAIRRAAIERQRAYEATMRVAADASRVANLAATSATQSAQQCERDVAARAEAERVASTARRHALDAARDALSAVNTAMRVVVVETAVQVARSSADHSAHVVAACAETLLRVHVARAATVSVRAATYSRAMESQALSHVDVAKYARRQALRRAARLSATTAATVARSAANDAILAVERYARDNAIESAANVARHAATFANTVYTNASRLVEFAAEVKSNVTQRVVVDTKQHSALSRISVGALRKATTQSRDAERAIVTLQSLFRGNRARQKLRAARQTALYDDGDAFEYEAIDVDTFLADMNDDVAEDDDFEIMSTNDVSVSSPGSSRDDVESSSDDADASHEEEESRSEDEESVRTDTMSRERRGRETGVRGIVNEWGFENEQTIKLMLKRRKRMLRGEKKRSQKRRHRRQARHAVRRTMRESEEASRRNNRYHRRVRNDRARPRRQRRESSSSTHVNNLSSRVTTPTTSRSWGGSERRSIMGTAGREMLTRFIHETQNIKNRLLGDAARFLEDEKRTDDSPKRDRPTRHAAIRIGNFLPPIGKKSRSR